ncbi:patatin-like phospholipase family protein [Thiomicrorhabdus hydrogeniphila]
MQPLQILKTTLLLLLLSSVITGCSSYGVINNKKQADYSKAEKNSYSIKSVLEKKPQGRIAFVLSFSGGGTRAAALAYGVLLELKNTKLPHNKTNTNLLDEVDIISAVSGGSFIAAYYGLNGDRTFKDFEKVMLQKNFEDELISEVLNPLTWFSDTGRTQLAIQLYNSTIFKDATFADLNKPGRPLILINASDLANGARFSFTQDYFDYICSDINSFSVAKAVTASSAVPVVFNPVVVQNFQPCNNGASQKLAVAEQNIKNNMELQQAINSLKEYIEIDYPYLQLVDGGITDNLGLRAIYESIQFTGGPKAFLQKLNKKKVKHIAVISVDASTESSQNIRMTNKSPTMQQSIDAMSDIQIHRYNVSTLQLFEQSLTQWGNQLSTKENTVEPHFIKISFNELGSKKEVNEFNLIPTRLSLTKPDMAKLIKAGRSLLKNNLEFQMLLQELDDDPGLQKAL